MNKNRIRITESELKRSIAESVKKVLKEAYKDKPLEPWYDGMENAYEADLEDMAADWSKATGEDFDTWDAAGLDYRRGGVAGNNPTFKRTKQVQMNADWDALERNYEDYKDWEKDRGEDREGENLNTYEYMDNPLSDKYWNGKNESLTNKIGKVVTESIKKLSKKDMSKKQIRLTENDLHRIVKESVRKVLKEGTTNKSVDAMWVQAQEMMGADFMLDALYAFLGEDTIEEFVQTLKREYELPLDEQ